MSTPRQTESQTKKPWHHEDSRQHDIFALMVERANEPDHQGLFAHDISAALGTTIEAVTYALKRLIDSGRATRYTAISTAAGRHAWRYRPVTPFDPSAWPGWTLMAPRRAPILAHELVSVHKCMAIDDDDEIRRPATDERHPPCQPAVTPQLTACA